MNWSDPASGRTAALHRRLAPTAAQGNAWRFRRIGTWLLRVLGFAWTLPNTVLGLAAGGVGLVLGAQAYRRPEELALAFAQMPWPWRGALTLGNVVLHSGESLDVACFTYAHRAGRTIEAPVCLADHERAHVYQAMVLGPLFLPVYLLCGGVSVRNPFERAADRYARLGRGWSPWTLPSDRARAPRKEADDGGRTGS